ncbi:MAG: xanthine dehydrogenase accessory protein XdhC [Planctomycetes bacterium]|nr:xanthine dehydrogenase accessory protein XdhC [Planctomycetota bacterium]
MDAYLQNLNELLNSRTPAVSVIMVDATGSTPQDRGSKMLVTQAGLHFGTVGGGRVEFRAIETAQAMLAEHNPNQVTQFVEWNLQKDIGMTCGGVVKLYFEVFNVHPWIIAVFGAGHVAGVLIPMLLNLDCQVTCLDTRQEWLDKLPASIKLRAVHSGDLPGEVEATPQDAFVLLMTQGHATDRPILQKLLERGKQPYLGVIGSKSKAAVLRRELKEAGLSRDKCERFTCPVGLSIGSNLPYEIAISITAQLLEVRDRVFADRA